MLSAKMRRNKMALTERNVTGAVAELRMTCPEKLNALSDAMIAELSSQLDDIAATPGIRAVILSAEGKAFCAGHDLKEMQAGRQTEDRGAAYFADLFARCGALMQKIQSIPQPVIAKVQGIAAAAGCQMVATCDLVVAADHVKFGVNGVNIGLFCSTPMVALTRAIPRKAAFEMLTTGRFIDTTEAKALGLINRAVPADQLDAAAVDLAETIAGKLASAVRVGKRAFYEQAGMTTAAAYDFAGGVMVQNMLDIDTAEGIQAFLEKRHPDWTQ
jgi:enoyl-CoA hydratase/carnithine racemase